MSGDQAPHYIGHRARLRDRFLRQGPRALADYELLELLLFLAKPRGDVKPLAKNLIARFGSFADVINAEADELMCVSGMGANSVAALKTAHAAALQLIAAPLCNRPILANWRHLIDYCRAWMSYLKIEQFRVFYLNRQNILMADEVMQEGTIDHAAVYPREVIRRALDLGAASVIMVHNHPGGTPQPSDEDVAMTREVAAALTAVGIDLHDHVVVARGGYASFKAMGLL